MPVTESSPDHWSRAYLLLRLGIGLIFAIHGARQFSAESYFNDLFLIWNAEVQSDLLRLFYAYLMPGVEIIAGFLLCFGFLKRVAITVLYTLMTIWIISSILLEYWQNMASQILFFFIL